MSSGVLDDKSRGELSADAVFPIPNDPGYMELPPGDSIYGEFLSSVCVRLDVLNIITAPRLIGRS